ncbi:hypothetical protein [Amycolatopsis sp. cmx-4-54]|uniref:hypothetical protein n=1 Tax=Amycolatopsis sp. cmx-4-54 TaxID=2790936 RepID=UPI00397D1032
MKKIGAAAIVAGTVLGTAITGAGVAGAAGGAGPKDCYTTTSCSLASGFFPGGTIHVDIDATGAPGSPDHWFKWTIGNCSGGGYIHAPAKTESCVLPASFYTLTTGPLQYPVNWRIGIRWDH